MDSEYDGKDEKMAERTQVKQKKALILLPYLKNGDGTAVALMNYYQELIEHGWRIDFLVLKIFECEWLNKVKADGNNIYELPKENKYSYKVKMLLVFYIASFVMGITESLVGYTLLFPIALYVGLLYEEEDYESISGRT